MKMIQPSARIGRFIDLTDTWVRKRLADLKRRREEQVIDGGLWAYEADDSPLDGGHYDDPHKPEERPDFVDEDLRDGGWEPLF